MSTSLSCVGSPTSKKLSSCVRPGVTDARAIALRPVTALISELLPTFERPAKATSGQSGPGRKSSEGAESRNSTRPAKSRRACSASSASGSIEAAALRRAGLVGRVLLGLRLELRVPRVEVLLLPEREHVRGDPVEQQAGRERRHDEHHE